MATIRRYFTVVGVLSGLLLAPLSAHASGESCTNDINCPTGSTCGGDVCDWTIGMKCRAATADGSGMEGWCTVDTDCKCNAEGATCNKTLFQCTKTVGASGGAGAAAGGASGTAGSTSSTNGGSTSAAAGTSSSSTAGSGGSGPTGVTPSAGTSSTAAGASSTSDSSSSSGCSVGGGTPRGSFGFALGAFGAALLIGARRRRSARLSSRS